MRKPPVPPTPPPTTPPTTTSQLRWFSGLALAAGLVAALLIPYSPGLNIVIIAAIMGAAVLVVARSSLGPVEWAFAIAGFLFLTMFAVRTSEALLFADLCAAAGLASLALSRGVTWRKVTFGGVAVLSRLHRGLGAVLAPVREASRGVDRVATAPWLRGSAIGLMLAVVFGVLFASADRAFAQIVGDLLVPEWDLGLLPVRVIAALITISFTGGYALLATHGPSVSTFTWTRPSRVAPRRLAAAEWIIPLALIDAVFVTFVIIQTAVLFGGHSHVLSTTGLTYAEYAREGFFQLVVIAVLSLAVIAAAVNLGAPEGRDRKIMQVLLGTLCVLTLVVLVSALRRLGLYEEAFGFTRLRFTGHVMAFWLSAVIVSVIIAGALWRGAWLPRVTVGLAAGALLIVNVVNPDAFIAARNIERWEATGKIDTSYLADLSLDAVPVLVDLPLDLRTCVLEERAALASDPQPIWSYNVGRYRARVLLEGLPEALGSYGGCPP